MPLLLPPTCERALLERFLRAESMALWAVQSAQALEIPPRVLTFLRRHEAEERQHLRQFEELLGRQAWDRAVLPQLPKQWSAVVVHLYGYEALGLEFAKLLADMRPDLASILEDEEVHVGFFEGELRRIMQEGEGSARFARSYARSWWRRLPRTVDRYLGDESLAPYRDELRLVILSSIEWRFTTTGLLGTVETAGSSAED